MVVGGGDAACEEALFLTRFARKVTLVHRRDTFRASSVMAHRVLAHPKIEFKPFRQVRSWIVDEAQGVGGLLQLPPDLAGAVLEDPRDPEVSEVLHCSGAFVAIGHQPMTSLVHGCVDLDDGGYIAHVENTMTSVPGVFAAGDVVDSRYRQAITAAGMGCQAALDTERWLAAGE
jgi:thioredoxin reductase (NADPH)